MLSNELSSRLESLINELIEEGGIDSTSLASILVAAQDSMSHGYNLELSQRVWLASNELRPLETISSPAEVRRKSRQVV